LNWQWVDGIADISCRVENLNQKSFIFGMHKHYRATLKDTILSSHYFNEDYKIHIVIQALHYQPQAILKDVRYRQFY